MYEIESVVFQGPNEPDRGYTAKASYLKKPHHLNALVEIFKDGQPVRKFLFPAYKIWNVVAHFKDIVDSESAQTTVGYEMTGWNRIG
jgi:hypothetical protein